MKSKLFPLSPGPGLYEVNPPGALPKAPPCPAPPDEHPYTDMLGDIVELRRRNLYAAIRKLGNISVIWYLERLEASEKELREFKESADA